MSNSTITQQVQGLATPTSPGLVGTGTQSFAGKKTFEGGAAIKGDTSGVPVGTGYVGQKVTWVTPPSSVTTTTTESDWSNATIVLDQGVWLIQASLVGLLQTGTTSGNDVELRVRITDSSNTTIQNFEKYARIQTAANAVTSLGLNMCFSGVQIVTAASTTYKIRARRVDNNGTNTAVIYNSAGVYSEFFAIRIA